MAGESCSVGGFGEGIQSALCVCLSEGAGGVHGLFKYLSYWKKIDSCQVLRALPSPTTERCDLPTPIQLGEHDLLGDTPCSITCVVPLGQKGGQA